MVKELIEKRTPNTFCQAYYDADGNHYHCNCDNPKLELDMCKNCLSRFEKCDCE